MNECVNKSVYARYCDMKISSEHRIQTSRLTGFSFTHFQVYVFWKKKAEENWNINVFENRATFFPSTNESAVKQGGGRILLGDNTGGGAVMMRPVRPQCAGGWISSELLCLYTCSWPHVRTVLTCTGPCERNYFGGSNANASICRH